MAIIKGRCAWANVLKPSQPKEFKSKGDDGEMVTNTIPPKYSIDLLIDSNDDAHKKFLFMLKKDKFVQKTGIYSNDKYPDLLDKEFLKISKKAVNKDGEVEKPVQVVDAKGNPYTGAIWNGSLVNIQYRVREFKTAAGKGRTLVLVGVQVLELAEAPQIEDKLEFTKEEGFVAPADLQTKPKDDDDLSLDDLLKGEDE